MPQSIVKIEKNETLRNQNFELFRDRYGENITIDPDEDNKYEAGIAKDGELVLYIKNATSSGDLRLNSLYDPAYEATRWADKQEILNRRTTLAIMGFSTGVFLKALVVKLRPDTQFFVYEPLEGLFAYLCAFVDISDIIKNSRITLAITERQRGVLSDVMIRDMATFRPEAKGIVTPFYSSDEAFDKLCEELEIVSGSNQGYQLTRGRNALRCRMYAWNHMKNAHIFADLIERMPKDIPAIIVAAGPSLRKNVEVLRQIKGHAFILCTDRALLVLEEYGIVPDALISLDAEKSPDYIRCKVGEKVPLICSYQLNKETQKLYNDRRIYFHALSYEYDLIGEKVHAISGLDLGGNVAGGAFCICELLGIKTIVLIGQDLAFLDGRHHADGKNDGVPKDDVKKIKGIDGGMVESNDMWIGFRNYYERQIILHPETRVIDATEGGALIEGSEIMTLQEVADTVCTGDYDLKGIFNDLPYAQNEDEYQETIKAEEKWLDDLDMIARNSKELETLCGQLLKISKYQDITDPKVNKKILKVDKLREEIYETRINTLLEEFWIEDLYSIPDYTFMIRNNEEAIPVFESAVNYYGKFPEEIEGFRKELLEAIEQGKKDNNRL